MFGDKLKQIRKEKNIKQEDLGKLLNVGGTTISNWENNITQPSIEQIVEIAKFFNVSTDYLMGITEDDVPKIEKLRQTLREAGIMVGTDLSYDELNRALRIVEMMKEKDVN